MNVKAISKNVGLALLVSALFMFLSVIVSVLNGKDEAFGPLLISFFITFITGVFPFIFVRETQPISVQEGYVIIVLSWILSFVFGMLPYVMWGGEFSLTDAWFESVSGYTTTGSTILENIEALPRSMLFWRSSTHFIGGLGVVVFLLLIVPGASPFRKRLTKMEMTSLSKEGYQLQSRKLVKVITTVYCSIFVVATSALFLAGMPLFDAVTHAFSVCATGGFSIKNASVAAYNSPTINVILMLCMIAATTNFAIAYACFVRRSLKPFFRNRMVQFYICSIILMAAVVSTSLVLQGGKTWSSALLDGLCTVVSYTTTTGFGFTDNSHWPFLASVVLMYASIQCACAGSTSSGIKVDRMIVVFKSVARQLSTLLHPSATKRIKFGESFIEDDQVLPIILYIVLYFIIAFISTGLLLSCGVGGVESVSGSIASLSNVGPGLGSISSTGNYNGMPIMAKIIFSLDMFLGRIEIYPFLIAVSLLFKKGE